MEGARDSADFDRKLRGVTWRKQPVSILNPASVVQPEWKRDDGATATIQGAFITVESPAAKKFKETKTN